MKNPNKSNPNYKQVKMNFGKTMKIPKTWDCKPFSEYIDSLDSGIWGNDCENKKNCFPVISSVEISHNGEINLNSIRYRQIPEDKIKKNLLKNDDILIVSSSGSEHLIGRVAFFHKNKKYPECLFSNFLLRLRTKNIVVKYIHYFLKSRIYSNFLKQLQLTSTGLRNFPQDDFYFLKFPIPTQPEQIKIVKILSNVDTVINETMRLEKQTILLKQGLMQKLLIKGVNHNSFKKIDWFFDKEFQIPQEWSLETIKNIRKTLQYGTSKKSNHNGKGLPVIGISNIKDNQIIFDALDYVELKDSEKEKFLLEKDDILTIRTNANINTIGKCAIFEKELNCAFASFLILIRCNKEKVLPKFLWYVLNSNIIRQQIPMVARTTVGKYNINKDGFDSLKFFLPSTLKEQEYIVTKISNIDCKIQLYQKQIAQFQKLKNGLIQQLLVGEKLVKV